jgi:hypothetical protein
LQCVVEGAVIEIEHLEAMSREVFLFKGVARMKKGVRM